MKKETIIKKIQEKKVKEYLQKNGIAKISLFGSYAKDKANKDSDIDLLFEEKKGTILSLFELAQIIGYLQDVLKKKVDLVEKEYIDTHIKKSILIHKIDII